MSDPAEHYILATGGRDIERLRLLHEVYGPGTEALFGRVGLGGGMRVVEIGCGSGNIACWVAEQVGPSGSVVGIDNSAEQVAQARRQAKTRGLSNIEFQVADAYSPRLPEGSFDVAYCRLVLMHLAEPRRALEQMRRLVRPGGRVVCEEMDLGVWLCDPPSEAMARFYEWNHARAGHGRAFPAGRVAASAVPRVGLCQSASARQLCDGRPRRRETAAGDDLQRVRSGTGPRGTGHAGRRRQSLRRDADAGG